MLAPDVPVTVTGGDIRGTLADANPDIVAFKGVPFAAPPVGDLRWKPTVMTYWTQFAATGNPNRDDLPPWPAYELSTDQHLNLGDPVTIGEGLHHAAGRLFKSFAMSRRAGT